MSVSPLGHETTICNGKHNVDSTRLPARIKLTKNIVLNSEFQLWKISTHPSKTEIQKTNVLFVRMPATCLYNLFNSELATVLSEFFVF